KPHAEAHRGAALHVDQVLRDFCVYLGIFVVYKLYLKDCFKVCLIFFLFLCLCRGFVFLYIRQRLYFI
ncbi:hypothetical protein, partial [Klebsiella pneumoniae]|uniref:hypothetical protein n=1 Tax=Klebsiella pneumoniae TaxID=573 RepID=UPI002731FDDA